MVYNLARRIFMEKVIILGTGNAGVKNCYNTCFALKNKNEYLLVECRRWKWYFKAARTGKEFE